MIHRAIGANIELCDKRVADGKRKWQVGVLLYHHGAGYPTLLGPELERMLKRVKVLLRTAGLSYWWDSERVGALMIKLSADDTSDHGVISYYNVPRFRPCIARHGDIEYLWRVHLGASGQYEIQCFRVYMDGKTGQMLSTQWVNWRNTAE